jgi:ribosomal protein RSM22 (predicted rRNA methylase)
VFIIKKGIDNISNKRFLSEGLKNKYDIVIGSYVLNEIVNEKEREKIIKNLWKSTNGVLIFIEPGIFIIHFKEHLWDSKI